MYIDPSKPSTSTLRPNFASIFIAALEAYKRKTKNDLASHPPLPKPQSCNSPEAILTVLRDQIPTAFSQSQNGDDRLTKWVTPTVKVLYSFSTALGLDVGQVSIGIFSREISALIFAFQAFPVNIILVGIGVLLVVRIFYDSVMQPIFDTLRTPRRLKIPGLETNSMTSLTTSKITSAGLSATLALHQLKL